MTRPALPALQSQFQDYLLRGDSPFIEQVSGDARADAATRLGIYFDAYRLRLIEALENDFTALRAQLGEQRFSELAQSYIAAHPSDHYSLRHFGRHLAGFLRATPPWRDDPLLAELAAFEWALLDAFDAADAPAATTTDMAAIAPEAWPGLVFTPHPSVIRLDLVWNAPALWKAAEDGRPLPEPERAPHPIGWVIWRQDLQTFFRSLKIDEAWALDAMRSGMNFAGICEGLTEWVDCQHVAGHAAGLLRQWLVDGLVSEIRTGA